jgi:hypothetical protein
MKIEIKPINLSHQKVTKTKEICLYLHKNHAEYNVIFKALEPQDRSNPGPIEEWDELVTNSRSSARKSTMRGVALSFVEDKEYWMITISLDGFSQDWKIFTETEKEGLEIKEKIERWLYYDN